MNGLESSTLGREHNTSKFNGLLLKSHHFVDFGLQKRKSYMSGKIVVFFTYVVYSIHKTNIIIIIFIQYLTTNTQYLSILTLYSHNS